MSGRAVVPEKIAALAEALADAERQRRAREEAEELAEQRREEEAERRRAKPPPAVAKLLETYRAWHAAAMTLPWLSQKVDERPMSVVPYGLEGVLLGTCRLGSPWVVDGRAQATLEIARDPTLRFSYWNVGYLAAMSGGRDLTPLDSLPSLSEETLDALTRYFEGGVWADLERKLERLGGRTPETRKWQD